MGENQDIHLSSSTMISLDSQIESGACPRLRRSRHKVGVGQVVHVKYEQPTDPPNGEEKNIL